MEIKDLKPYELNAKNHPKEQIEKIKHAILNYGFIQPIVIDKHNVVIAGHGRLKAAKQLGFKEIIIAGSAKKGEKFIPVVIVDDLTDDEIKELRILDNKLNESEWDMVKYEEEVNQFSIEFQELIGFKIEELSGDIQELKGKSIKSLYEVVIECEGESEQEKVYKELVEQGYNCRLLSM